MQTVRVRHNFEAAHRLWLTEGKCQQIHGHSWWCTLSLMGEVDEYGILVEFGQLKKSFRSFLDGNFDHKLLLNREDLYAQPFNTDDDVNVTLPGLETIEADPTTENLAAIIGKFMESSMPDNVKRVSVELWETQVNCATWWTER